MEQVHCGAKEMATFRHCDLCACGKTNTMSHIVESCLLTKLNGGLSQLHSADEDAVVSWLTNYGSWHAYEKKTNSNMQSVLNVLLKNNTNLILQA